MLGLVSPTPCLEGRRQRGVRSLEGVMETSPHGFAPSHLSAASNPSASDQKGFDLHFRAPSQPSSPQNPADLILPSPLPQLNHSPSDPPSTSAVPPRCFFSPGLAAAATSNHKAEQIKRKKASSETCSLAGNIKARRPHSEM